MWTILVLAGASEIVEADKAEVEVAQASAEEVGPSQRMVRSLLHTCTHVAGVYKRKRSCMS